MGSVADKMAKKIASSRGSKVVDLAMWREGKKMALDAGLGGEGPIPAKFADHDPCHGIYAWRRTSPPSCRNPCPR